MTILPMMLMSGVMMLMLIPPFECGLSDKNRGKEVAGLRKPACSPRQRASPLWEDYNNKTLGHG